MKRVLQFFMVRMSIVMTFGIAVVAFTPVAVAHVPVSASTPASTIALVSGWIQTNWPASNSFFSLYASQDKVFARIWDSLNGGRMFLTTDDGANWTQTSSADSDIDILSIVVLNSNILAGTWNGLYLSTDGGTTFNAFTPTGIPADTAIWSIAMIDTTLFVGTTGDIYKSSDNGNTWTEVSSGIPMDARITSIVASGNAILAGSASNGVFKTTNGGTSWTAINSGLTDTHISQLAALGTRSFAATLTGFFISDNGGTSWAADSSGLENINCLVVVNDQLFAGTDCSGVYLSVDSGATWTSFSSGIPANTRVWSLAVSSDSIFAGTNSGVWVTALPRVLVETKIFLEGPYSGSSMNTALNTILPTSQPYNSSPWNYSGSEGVLSAFFASHTDIVDWVLVELRKTYNGASVGRRAAFIKNDGTIVDVDGTSPVVFTGKIAGNYYIVIRHRNHLAIMSASAVALSASSSLYDCTTSQSQAYGVSPMKLVGAHCTMYAGDGNQSGIVTASDANAAYGVINTTGYNVNDVNLSGIVTATDANVVFGNINKVTQVP